MALHGAEKTNDTPTQKEQNKGNLQKPLKPGEGCLVEERVSQQIEVLFRWPIQLLLFSSNNQQALIAQSLTQRYKPLAKVPLQHFYRTILFPFHSNT